jgi:murein tripeptide amidase MpaA
LSILQIDAYLDEVATTYSNIATLITIGASYEGRTMRVLKLSNGPGKTGIWFEAAIHAREWLAPPVVLYTINELTENLALNQAMLDKNDFYLLPVANPDGYVYTWTTVR